MQDNSLEKDKHVLVIVTGAGVNVQGIIDIAERFSKIVQDIGILFGELFERSVEIVRELYETIKKINFDEFDREYKRDLYRLDFSRPRIQHQVLDRKPRNLIKKII